MFRKISQEDDDDAKDSLRQPAGLEDEADGRVLSIDSDDRNQQHDGQRAEISGSPLSPPPPAADKIISIDKSIKKTTQVQDAEFAALPANSIGMFAPSPASPSPGPPTDGHAKLTDPLQVCPVALTRTVSHILPSYIPVEDFNWLADDSVDGTADNSSSTPAFAVGDTGGELSRKFMSWWRSCAYWIRKSIILMVLLPTAVFPGCLSYYYLPSEPMFERAKLSLWSLFFSMCIFTFSTLEWGIVLILNQAWRSSASQKRREMVENFLSLRRNWFYAVWSLIVWITWRSVIHNRLCPGMANATCAPVWSLWFINPTMEGIWVSCLGLLLEKAVLQNIALGFHKTAYQERIQKSRFAGEVLDTMLKMVPKIKKKGEAAGRFRLRSINNLSKGGIADKSHQHIDSSALNPADQSATMLSPASAASEDGYKESLRNNPSVPPKPRALSGDPHRFYRARKLLSDINDADDAKRIAKKIFERIAAHKKDQLVIADFEPYFKDPAVVKDAFAMFDVNMDGAITRREMKDVVLGVFRERKNLTKSLTDLEHALSALDRIMIAILLLMLIFTWLIIFDVNVLQILLTLSSMIVASAFITGGTARNSFDSLIFIFVYHPFDVGDRIVVDDTAYIVKQIHIMSTVLIRTADGVTVYYTNFLLSTKVIHNVRRSGDMTDSVSVDVPFITDTSKIMELRSNISEFVKSYGIDFLKVDLLAVEVSESHKLKLNVTYTAHGNFQDGQKRAQRKQAILFCIKDAMRELGIEYKGLLQQVELRDMRNLSS